MAYGADGSAIFPNRQGVIWYEGKGYLLAERDQEGEAFRQDEPDLRPLVEFTEDQTREVFQQLSQNLWETIGDYGGYLALGAVLAYAAGPEIYQKWVGFPLLWVYGLAHQGKTSLARWLVRVWGFNLQEGTVLGDTTQVGLAILLQQYGNLPVWLEEHQETSKILKPWLPEKIKSILTEIRAARRPSVRRSGACGPRPLSPEFRPRTTARYAPAAPTSWSARATGARIISDGSRRSRAPSSAFSGAT